MASLPDVQYCIYADIMAGWVQNYAHVIYGGSLTVSWYISRLIFEFLRCNMYKSAVKISPRLNNISEQEFSSPRHLELPE